MPPHHRPSLNRDDKPRSADDEAGGEQGKSGPFVSEERRRTDGESTNDERIGHEQRIVAGQIVFRSELIRSI